MSNEVRRKYRDTIIAQVSAAIVAGAFSAGDQTSIDNTPTGNGSGADEIQLIGGYTDTDVAGIAYFDDVSMGEAVSQAMLKTSSGSVSTTTTVGINLTLPGGEYGYYPQIKSSGASLYAGPDHPCMGNGNDPGEVQHPFGDYDPTKHEIVVINPSREQLQEIDGKRQWKNGAAKRCIGQVINEEYEIDEASRPPWPDKYVTVGLNREQTAPVKSKIPKPDFVEVRTLKLKGA